MISPDKKRFPSTKYLNGSSWEAYLCKIFGFRNKKKLVYRSTCCLHAPPH